MIGYASSEKCVHSSGCYLLVKWGGIAYSVIVLAVFELRAKVCVFLPTTQGGVIVGKTVGKCQQFLNTFKL